MVEVLCEKTSFSGSDESSCISCAVLLVNFRRLQLERKVIIISLLYYNIISMINNCSFDRKELVLLQYLENVWNHVTCFTP